MPASDAVGGEGTKRLLRFLRRREPDPAVLDRILRAQPRDPRIASHVLRALKGGLPSVQRRPPSKSPSIIVQLVPIFAPSKCSVAAWFREIETRLIHTPGSIRRTWSKIGPSRMSSTGMRSASKRPPR